MERITVSVLRDRDGLGWRGVVKVGGVEQASTARYYFRENARNAAQVIARAARSEREKRVGAAP